MKKENYTDAEKLLYALSAPPSHADPNSCEHKRTQGDNYGVSCLDCNKTLRGYGFGGWFGSRLNENSMCIHGDWYEFENVRTCIYCEASQQVTAL